MNKCDAGTVLMDLPAEDFAAAAAAFAAVGIASAALDTAGNESSGGFLLIGADTWDRIRSRVEPRVYTVILVIPPEGEGAVAGLLEQGAFDFLVGGNPGWAERAAAYFHALIALDRRFAGGISKLERRYEDLVHSLPDIVYELDSDGCFTFVNNSISLLGYSPSDLLGKHFSMLLCDEDADAVDRAAVLDAFRGISTGPALSPKLFNERRSIERRTENLEVRLRPRPKPGARLGTTEDLIVTVISYGEVTSAGEYTSRSTIRDFMGSVGVIRDISLRRKSEEMLRKLYQAVDQLSAGILVADRSFVIEYVNPGFFKITGLRPQDVIGAELFSFFDFPPGKAAEIRSLILEGFDADIELRLARPRGRSSGSASRPAEGGPWAALHASPVRSPSGLITHAILICEDISQRKAMEELIGLAKEEAERANGAKSDFLASMSHELKSPIASILAAARLIEMGGPEPERRAASIISSAQGLLGMLGDILDFARFETGTGTLRKYAFPLPGFVARICDAARKRAEAKGLGFEVGSIPDENLHSDPDRLGRAFAAILDNAVSFTEKGKVRVDAAIERRQGNVPYLTLTVSDTGPGILPEDQGRIFSPFVQLASPYTKRGGAGIGLSLAHNIVRALGGEVRLQSDVGRGSVFTLLVPVGDLETHSGAAQVTEHRPLRRVYRLLVVDDNEVNLEYMAVILSNAGHRALTAANGAEALRRLEEMPPDAAILDIQMPGMSGIDLGRKVRDYTGGRYDPNLPLVALTAFDSEEVGRSGIDFDGVFDKPVDVPKLLSFLDAVVDLRESPSASVFAAHWAGRSAEGERSLAAALEEIPGLVARMKDAIAAADLEAMRPAARAMGAQLRLLGDERGAAAYRRLALAVSDEDGAVIACRADRLASNCALELEMLKTLFNG
jgi:PAS domain S-box-containing protein